MIYQICFVFSLLLGLMHCQNNSRVQVFPESKVEDKLVISVIEVKSTDENLEKAGGILFYKNQPFSGIRVEKYPNGQTKSGVEYFAGKQSGLALGWYSDGTKQFERKYKGGEKDGLHCGWWPNGQMKFKYTFDQGIYIGELKEWYSNGQLYRQMHYDKSGQEMDLKMWMENGKIQANYVVKNGRRFGLIGKKSCYSVKEPSNVSK